MTKNLDENVGRILDHLKRRGLERNTVVIFASDNGGYVGSDPASGRSVPVTNNAPLRSGKGSLYEGGIRVPLMIRWPGVAQRGATCDEPVVLTDLFQTLLSVARLPPATKAADGIDLAPLLKNPAAKLNRDALFFHYPHYYHTTTPVSAIRARDWKLLEYFEDNHAELYNLRDDPSERRDLAKQMPEPGRRASPAPARVARCGRRRVADAQSGFPRRQSETAILAGHTVAARSRAGCDLTAPTCDARWQRRPA